MDNVSLKSISGKTPKWWLCPYCGKWHKWIGEEGLYESDIKHPIIQFCTELPSNVGRRARFYHQDVDGMDIAVCLDNLCGKAKLESTSYFGTYDILAKLKEGSENEGSIGTFIDTIRFDSDNKINKKSCYTCEWKNKCQVCAKGESGNGYNIPLKVGLSWNDNPEYQKDDKQIVSRSKRSEGKENEKKEEAKAMSETGNLNSMFNFNDEFGLNEDENIISTLMGIAVYNGLSWRIYDKTKKSIIDVGDISMESMPIYIVPSTKVSVGDLLRVENRYVFVTEIKNGRTETMDAETGEYRTVAPIRNILGFSCYTKVVAFSDMMDFTSSEFNMEKFVMMSAMSGKNSNMMLPLMMMDKEDGNFDADNMLMFLAMSNTGSGEYGSTNNQMNMLPLMMMMKSKDEDSDMTKMLMMMSMSSGNTQNPMLAYMMAKMIDKKEAKKDEKAESSDTAQQAVGKAEEE